MKGEESEDKTSMKAQRSISEKEDFPVIMEEVVSWDGFWNVDV